MIHHNRNLQNNTLHKKKVAKKHYIVIDNYCCLYYLQFILSCLQYSPVKQLVKNKKKIFYR